MEKMNECASGGTGGLEGELVSEGKPELRVLERGVDVFMDDDALQDSRENWGNRYWSVIGG